MDNYTKIESTDIEQLCYRSGLVKETKLHAIKKSIIIEKDNKRIWQQKIEICDPQGNEVLSLYNGYLGPYGYVQYRVSDIVCHKNFFVVCNKETVKTLKGTTRTQDVFEVYTYKGIPFDKYYTTWKNNKGEIKKYNTLAQNIDLDNSK